MSLNKTREAMIAILAESLQASDPNERIFIRTVEEFYGNQVPVSEKGGIWTSGESGYTYKGRTAFNYYNESAQYPSGVYRPLANMLEKHGWYAEWHDPGTIFIFEI
jgi:hypothetical protein